MSRKKVISIIMSMLLILVAVGCTANAEEEVFSLPKEQKQIEGTAVYEGTDFFDGMEFGMSFEDYVAFAEERYGEGTTMLIEDIPSAYEGHSSVWQYAHTKLYDPSREINSYVTAVFRDGKLDQMSAGSLVYATSVDNFKRRAEVLIAEHEDIYGKLDESDMSLPAGSVKYYDEWEHREWWSEDAEKRVEKAFQVDIALPDNLDTKQEYDNTVYYVEPYDEGEAGVIIYTNIFSKGDGVTPGNFNTEEMLWFTNFHNAYNTYGIQ